MKTFLFFYFQVSSSLYYTQRRIPAIFGKREFVSNILFGVGLVVSKKNNKEVEWEFPHIVLRKYHKK